MRHALFALAVAALPSAATGDEVDVARLLVGRWEGDIQLHGRGNPARVLVVDKVDVGLGTFSGKYAVGEGRLGPLKGQVERVGSFVVVRFTSPQRGRAELRLISDGVLVGEYHLDHAVSGTARTIGRPMRLERVPASPPR